METSIFPINMGLDTVYALRAEGVILIDAGDPHQVGRLKQGLERASIKPEEVRLIVLTHGHWDHVGSARDIQELTGARILMHRKDLHFLEDPHPSQPAGVTAWGKLTIALLKLYSHFIRIPAFTVDIPAGDEEFSLAEYGIPGKVVHTPGHSWGSVSVILDSGQAFVGDLAMNMFPLRLDPGLPIFADDLQLVKDSWRKLLSRGAKVIYPAHGKPFPAEVLRQELV